MYCYLCRKDLTEEFHWRCWVRLVDGSIRSEQLAYLSTWTNFNKPLELVPVCIPCGGRGLWITTLEGIG